MKDKMLFINSAIEKASMSKKDKNLKIAGYANTTSKDRAGDIVTADAWAKGVDNFRRNPVLLYQHKHDCPIGKVNKITVDKKGIFVAKRNFINFFGTLNHIKKNYKRIQKDMKKNKLPTNKEFIEKFVKAIDDFK